MNELNSDFEKAKERVNKLEERTEEMAQDGNTKRCEE